MSYKIVKKKALDIPNKTITVEIDEKEYSYEIKPYLTYIEQQTIVNSAGDAFINGVIATTKDEEGKDKPTQLVDGTLELSTNFMLANRVFDTIVATICCKDLFDDLGYDGMLARGYFRVFPQMIIGYSEAKQGLYTALNERQRLVNSIPEFFKALTPELIQFFEITTKELSKEINDMGLTENQMKTIDKGTAKALAEYVKNAAKKQKTTTDNGEKTA